MAANPSLPSSHGLPALGQQSIGSKRQPFDQLYYQKLIRARGETIRKVLQRLKSLLDISTAVDAGAGVGFFSQTLLDCGLHVCGFDGRAENVDEARKRFPHIPFECADIQDPAILELGKFDLTLCFGLLYHLENPLLAIRHLRTLTEKCLLLESMCVPDEKPSMLLREEPREDDQSLTDVAYYPSEDSLIKMLYRAGFTLVYRVVPLPDHDDFRDTREHRGKRTVLLATAVPIDIAGFRLCIEGHENQDPWTKSRARLYIFHAHQPVPGPTGRQKIFYGCQPSAPNFSISAYPLALTIRRMVATGKR
jgi:hypothetical protein